jgi:hypothetical protein
VVLRKVVELFGPPDLRQKVVEIEEQEAEPLDKITLDKIALDKEGPG